jgi:hypothetical protein
MFRTTYGQGRKEEHPAPVENYEEENTTMAKKKQILFFALVSPKDPALSAADSDDLAGLNGFKVGEADRHKRDEAFQEDRLSAENDYRDVSMLQVLLVFKSAINRQKNVEFRVFGCT